MDRNAGMFQDRKDTGHRLAAAFSRDKDGVLGDGYGTDHQDLFDFPPPHRGSGGLRQSRYLVRLLTEIKPSLKMGLFLVPLFRTLGNGSHKQYPLHCINPNLFCITAIRLLHK